MKAKIETRMEAPHEDHGIWTREFERVKDRGRLTKKKGVYILNLEGDDYEMGFQHGYLLKEEIYKGAPVFFRDYIERLIEKEGIGRYRVVRRALFKLIDRVLNYPILYGLPSYYLDGYRGIADATGVERGDALKLIMMPDLLLIAISYIYGSRRFYYPSFNLQGCSSFIVSPPATRGGTFIHGRNMDFDGMGYWERYPTIIFFKPRKGLKYMAVTSAGIHTAGITGVNEEGLSINFNTNLSADTSMRGLPITFIADRIIRFARNIPEAMEILEKSKPCAGWTIMIADAGRMDGVVVELSPRFKRAIRLKDGMLAATNCYQTERLRSREINLSPGVTVNLYSRLERLRYLLKESYGNIDVVEAISFLSDHHDINTGKWRAVGDVISQVNNIQSTVITMREGTLWMSRSPAPACNGTFVGFDFYEEMERPPGSTRLPIFSDTTFYGSVKYRGLRRYIEANNAYTFEGNPFKADSFLSDAIEIDPEEPVYYLMRGLLNLRMNRFREAKRLFGKGVTLPDGKHRKDAMRLWYGRSRDLTDERGKALLVYHQLLEDEDADPRIRHGAEKGCKRPFSRRDTANISIAFWVGDSYHY